MTLINLTCPLIYPANHGLIPTANIVLSDFQTLDAATEHASLVFVAKEAMTITHVGALIGSVAGSPTADVRVETVDPATGFPSGTLWAANTNAISATLTNGWNLTALTASASIVAGDKVAIKIVYNSGTSLRVRQLGSTVAITNLPYLVTNTSGSDVRSAPSNIGIAVGSSATAFYFIPNALAAIAANNNVFSNSVAGAKRGLRFQLPFRARCSGIVHHAAAQAGDYNARLSDDSGAELSNSSTAFDGDISAVASQRSHYSFFDNPVTLSANTWYRAELEPSSATNIALSDVQLASANYLPTAGWVVGTAHLFTYTTAGGYIDTATDKLPCVFPLLDQIDDGTGAIMPTGKFIGD